MQSPEFTVSGCLFFCLLLLTLPLPWVAAALGAAAFHEVCHMAMILALGGRILGFRLGAFGASIDLSPMTPGREFLAAAAGPAGSFLLLLTAGRFPRLALWGLFQGLFNLLPLYPMDGGRMLLCFLRVFLKADRVLPVFRFLSILCLSFLALLSLFLPVPYGILLFLSLIFPIFRLKIPCKDRIFRVQ